MTTERDSARLSSTRPGIWTDDPWWTGAYHGYEAHRGENNRFLIFDIHSIEQSVLYKESVHQKLTEAAQLLRISDDPKDLSRMLFALLYKLDRLSAGEPFEEINEVLFDDELDS